LLFDHEIQGAATSGAFFIKDRLWTAGALACEGKSFYR
jgi:hypothetical protein